MTFNLIKLKLFITHHLNKFLLTVSLLFFINIFLYSFVFVNIPEWFKGAHKLGIIINALSMSVVASYIFYLINFEITSFNGKIKSYLFFFKKKDNIDFQVDMLIKQFIKNEKLWMKTSLEEKSRAIKKELMESYFLREGFSLEKLPELDNETINSIVSFNIESIGRVVQGIQNEFNSLNIHSKYLSSKLSILIAVVQEFELFNFTYMFYSMGEMVGKDEWDYNMFAKEYASTIDHLIEFINIFKNEINPYWVLFKDKSMLEIIKN